MEVHSLDIKKYFNIDTTQYHLHNWRSILIGYRLWESLTWYNTSPQSWCNTRPVLILLTRLSLILLTSSTIQHRHLNHMRILMTSYNTVLWLDTTQVLENHSWRCTINNIHLITKNHVLWYLKGTIDYGLIYVSYCEIMLQGYAN